MAVEYPKMAQGMMKPATSSELVKDEDGYTHPNLHRRLDIQPPSPESGEFAERQYDIGVMSVNSYRTTTMHFHDEDSDVDEIP